MAREITVAAVQTRHGWDAEDNIRRVLAMAERAADAGAGLVLPSELFETPYFCKTPDPRHRALARPAEGHPVIARFAEFAARRGVVVPVSFYERAGEALYNSVAVIDADGSLLGIYRKCHIPAFEAYHEDAFFAPSPEGPKVWQTRIGRLGVGICWDQWFPELARAMALMGAELIVYPTAIGSETFDPGWDSAGQWQAVMRGHAAANLVPVLAANRIGRETDDGVTLEFYGCSFAADHRARMVAEAPRGEEALLLSRLDLDAAARDRKQWGTFQTRQPQHYAAVVSVPAGPPPAG
ncbi:N-carbamoylputrescine amidase [Paralimibaculum aggregatum]|uniref:N-carbamoylputrescine amidase n=1 Tax=Paralimibaculum aggregatum TaxID=3036245 RepID=A0ABQ6LJ20_9RHOB|nr:nitrilase-related carbon-nitrogen hydrolase [Limibaculum sp. NKW23]GMG82149.1 N-carbamoylputrescine amidase [Limibaculum sp. NKW23]